MSITLLALAKSFQSERLSADEFANAYMELWKFERDIGLLQKDNDLLEVCLSTIFCLADAYHPDTDREEYELDEKQLRDEISELIENLEKDIHPSRQGKHVFGHSNFAPIRSPLAKGIDPQELLDGVKRGDYPIVRHNRRQLPVADFGRVIGQYKGKAVSLGAIHYGKKGAYIVPTDEFIYYLGFYRAGILL